MLYVTIEEVSDSIALASRRRDRHGPGIDWTSKVPAGAGLVQSPGAVWAAVLNNAYRRAVPGTSWASWAIFTRRRNAL